MRSAVLCLSLAGCAVGAGSDEPAGPAIGDQDTRSTGEDCQGRHVLGFTPDVLAPSGFVSFRTESSNRKGVFVSLTGGELVAKTAAGAELYRGRSASFVGMRLKSDLGNEIEIRGVSAQSYGAGYQIITVANAADYCGGQGAAVPLQGSFETDRFHVLNTNVSFACDDGAAKKCEGWGYVPGADPNSVGWRHHQACIRMANADVYGNGEVHTRELTPIVIRDMIPGAQPAPLDAPALSYPDVVPAPPEIPYFEAAWGWKRGQGAICLAKRRWMSLPADAPPHSSLPDPRNIDGVPFCEDLTVPQMIEAGALLFNASRRMDMYLNRWRNPSTGNLVSTVRGYVHHDAARRTPPFPGYTEFLGSDGIVLRSLTGTLTDDEVTPLHVQQNPVTGDVVLASDTPVTPNHVVGEFEGWMLNNQGPALVPFGLFVNGTDFVSSIADPPSPGYTRVAPMRFVMHVDGTEISSGVRAAQTRGAATSCKTPQ